MVYFPIAARPSGLPCKANGKGRPMMGFDIRKGGRGLSLNDRHETGAGHRSAKSWPARISDNLAYGLLVYTALQIFVTMKQLKEVSNSMLPYLALVVLVAMIIPAARWLERHWTRMSESEVFEPSHARRFQRDRAIIWLVAVGLPFALAGIARCAALVSD